MAVGAQGLEGARQHGFQTWSSGAGPLVLSIAGPPFSALLFRHLAARSARGRFRVVAPELFHPPARPSDLPALAARLGPFAAAAVAVVGHGLGNPLAIELAARHGQDLVLADGPIGRLDGGSRGLARFAATAPRLAEALLTPGVFRAALASSLGLRRAVVNPYVMDRDIVAMLGAPLHATAGHRAAVVDYLGSLLNIEHAPGRVRGRVRLVWGTGDLLYPLPADPRALFPNARELSAIGLDGARFLHVEERPSELAAVIEALVAGATAT